MCDLTIFATPAQLREIADDLEREGDGHFRTLMSPDGFLVDIYWPEVLTH